VDGEKVRRIGSEGVVWEREASAEDRGLCERIAKRGYRHAAQNAMVANRYDDGRLGGSEVAKCTCRNLLPQNNFRNCGNFGHQFSGKMSILSNQLPACVV